MTDRREELREENHARDQAGLPSGVLRARTDLIPAPEPEPTKEHAYLYPVRGEHESLDERMLADLLRRVQDLERDMAAQQEVIKALVTWRMAHARMPHGGPGSTQGPAGEESRPGGQEEPEQGPGVLPDFLT